MPLVVTDQCANCRVCLPACPVDCFFEDEAADRVYINPTECIGCLCCYLICPHDAANQRSSTWKRCRILGLLGRFRPPERGSSTWPMRYSLRCMMASLLGSSSGRPAVRWID